MPATVGNRKVGMAVMANFFEELIEAGVIEHKFTLIDALEDGHLVYQRWLWAALLVNEKGEKQTFVGNIQRSIVNKQMAYGKS